MGPIIDNSKAHMSGLGGTVKHNVVRRKIQPEESCKLMQKHSEI